MAAGIGPESDVSVYPITGDKSKLNKRILFVVRALSQEQVDIDDVKVGNTPLSGSLGSVLLVADGLASRSIDVAVHSRDGRIVSSAAKCIPDVDDALRWASGGLVVCVEMQEQFLALCEKIGVRVILWTQLPIEIDDLRRLVPRLASGLVVVSDTVKLPFLHSHLASRIARIYNPLNPFFAAPPTRVRSPEQPFTVMFAGFIGESKGVHRLFQVWAKARRRRNDIELRIAGSSMLYGQEVGPLGIADEAFEEKYVKPLIDEFGSFAGAGITMLGLLGPKQLQEEYSRADLGVVNLNTDSYTETFCCAAVEMVATGLPVFSVAAGALPETIGRTTGAFLSTRKDVSGIAEDLIKTVDVADQARHAQKPREYIAQQYGLAPVVEEWESLIERAFEQPNHIATASTGWNGPRNLRYALERIARVARLGGLYRFFIELSKRRLSKPAP